MNRLLRAAIEVPTSIIKLGLIKLVHGKKASVPFFSAVSPSTEITISTRGTIKIGKGFHARSGSHICARESGILEFGSNVFINHNSMIFCRDHIKIGDNVQISPGVMIYDHDHDFKAEGGIKSKKFKTEPVKIGNNVWIGANTVILRGTEVGDNCVIGAGSVIKGVYPEGSVVVQKRHTEIRGGV